MALALVAFHLISTATLMIVMVEVHGGQAEKRKITELMGILANSICGPAATPHASRMSSMPTFPKTRLPLETAQPGGTCESEQSRLPFAQTLDYWPQQTF